MGARVEKEAPLGRDQHDVATGTLPNVQRAGHARRTGKMT